MKRTVSLSWEKCWARIKVRIIIPLLDEAGTRVSIWTRNTQSSKEESHGPLAKYVKLRVGHAPGMPGTFSPPTRVSDPDMRHGTCVTHVPWCMPGSLTSDFPWSRWRGKRFRRMRKPQLYVSGKRPMAHYWLHCMSKIRDSNGLSHWILKIWGLVQYRMSIPNAPSTQISLCP